MLGKGRGGKSIRRLRSQPWDLVTVDKSPGQADFYFSHWLNKGKTPPILLGGSEGFLVRKCEWSINCYCNQRLWAGIWAEARPWTYSSERIHEAVGTSWGQNSSVLIRTFSHTWAQPHCWPAITSGSLRSPQSSLQLVFVWLQVALLLNDREKKTLNEKTPECFANRISISLCDLCFRYFIHLHGYMCIGLQWKRCFSPWIVL